MWAQRWRKADKRALALKAFLKAVPALVSLETFKAAFLAHGRGLMATRPDEVMRPMLATWINQKCWKDEPPAPYTAVAKPNGSANGHLKTFGEQHAENVAGLTRVFREQWNQEKSNG